MENDKSIYKMVHISQASDKFNEDTDIEAILNKLQKNNSAQGITGALLYFNGFFVQLFESDSKESVETAYNRIKPDPRHYRVTKLMDTYEKERSFEFWSMAYTVPKDEDISKFDGMIDLDSFKMLLEFGESKVLKLILDLYNNNNPS